MTRLLQVQQLIDKWDTIDKFLNNKQKKENIVAQLSEYLDVLEVLPESVSKLQEIESQISSLQDNPEKYDRIAVIFVGHYRTLKLCMPHHSWFFNQMAKHVDYYFVTWEMNDYPESEIIKNKLMQLTCYDTDLRLNIFGSLLKGHRFVEDLTFSDFNFNPRDNYGLWKILRLTYLAKIAQQLKKEYEVKHNFVYDQVIETRPDLYFSPRTDNDRYRLIDCPDNYILTDSCTIDQDTRTWDSTTDSIDQFHSGDWYWRMSSGTYDKYSNRYDFFANFLTQYPADAAHRETFKSFHTCMASYFLANRHFKFVNNFDFGKLVTVQSVSDVP